MVVPKCDLIARILSRWVVSDLVVFLILINFGFLGLIILVRILMEGLLRFDVNFDWSFVIGWEDDTSKVSFLGNGRLKSLTHYWILLASLSLSLILDIFFKFAFSIDFQLYRTFSIFLYCFEK